jgi:hypothetical protein
LASCHIIGCRPALGAEDLGSAQALVEGDAGADEGHVVVLAGAEHLGAADEEGLPCGVQAGYAPRVVRR